ncbi:hypothetical protein ES703_85126 [subsurface metagenome]
MGAVVNTLALNFSTTDKILKATWGQKVGGANDCFLHFSSETLTEDIEELLSAAQRGILDEPKSYQGERSFGGDLVLEVHPGSIGHILRSALNVPEDPVAADTTETELDKCDAKWVGHDSIISEIDTTDKKKGDAAIKLTVPAGVAEGTILATKDFDPVVITSDTHIKFWIKSSIIMNEGDLVFVISELPACTGTNGEQKDITITALEANVWKELTLDITPMTNYDAVISIGIKLINDKVEFILRGDDVRRVVTGTAQNAKKHVFIPRQATDFHADCPINPYTLEVYRDQGQAFQFLGAIINTLALNFSTTDKILKTSNGIIAKNSGDTPKTAPSFETTDPFTWEQAVISIAGSPNNDIDTFGINYDNLCIGKYALNNTAILRKIIRSGFRTIPVNFTIDFVDRAEYDKFIAGTEQAFQVKFVGAECEAGYYYTLQIDIPKFRYLTYPINMGGPGPIVCGVTGKAKYDTSLGYPFKITLINLETGY